jgi:hypothetical protein
MCANYLFVDSKFYILLTVHLDVILVNDQLDALFLKVPARQRVTHQSVLYQMMY